MAQVARGRWDGATQTEEDIREYFESENLDKAFEAYSGMRKMYELAGKLLDTRVQAERNQEACEYCGKKFDKDNPWFNRDPVKDMATGIIRNIFTCSQACMIALRGKKQRA